MVATCCALADLTPSAHVCHIIPDTWPDEPSQDTISCPSFSDVASQSKDVLT